MEFLFTALASLFGAFTQRITGFGFGILVMVFFPYFTATYGEATGLSNFINSPLAIAIAVKHWKNIKWKVIVYPLISSIIARIICINIVAQINGDYTSLLKRILGGFLIVLSIYFFIFSKKIKFTPTPLSGTVSGLVSGVTDGFFAMGGPPIIAYLVSSFPDDKESYIATSQAYSAVSGLFGLGMRIASGLVTSDVLIMSVFGIVGMAVGILIGAKVSNKMNAETMRKTIYVFMAVSGAVALIKG